MTSSASPTAATRDWVGEYNAAVSAKPVGPAKVAGVGCCPVCCTFFSLFGAMFLFIMAGLMNSDYPYMHIHGKLPDLSASVTFGGVIYLVCAAISIVFWVRAAMRAGYLRRQSQFSELRA